MSPVSSCPNEPSGIGHAGLPAPASRSALTRPDTPEATANGKVAADHWSRRSEITDQLVDLLVALVHRIDARAEHRVEGELLADLRRVRGKQGILFALATAAVEHPDETVRAALYPVVDEATLRATTPKSGP